MSPEREPFRYSLVAAAAALGGLAVIFGAFGAHAFKGRLGVAQLEWWNIAVQFQMWTALVVLVLGIGGADWMSLPAWLLAAGIVIFSGSLYLMALGAPDWLGAITPVGGMLMIAGWGLLFWRAVTKGRSFRD